MQSTCISRSSTTYRTSDTIARKMDNALPSWSLKCGGKLDVNHSKIYNIPNCDKFYKYKGRAFKNHHKAEIQGTEE